LKFSVAIVHDFDA